MPRNRGFRVDADGTINVYAGTPRVLPATPLPVCSVDSSYCFYLDAPVFTSRVEMASVQSGSECAADDEWVLLEHI